MVGNRGSEWRRWDLHIHTPETKKNDQYVGKTREEKWDNFYDSIKDYTGDGTDERHNVVVMGITDYLSIDNYKKVIQDDRLPKSIKLVLPNVEMRVTPVASEAPINIHFLFEPSIADELEDRFFSKLKFNNGDRDFSAARGELISLGKTLKCDATIDEAYKLGINQYIPTIDSLRKVFKDDPKLREKTLIGVSNSSNDGVSGAVNNSSYFDTEGRNSQLDTVRHSIYKFADFIFSAKPSDILYFLGKKSDDEKTVIEKCGSLKPCLHGSDAHSLKKIFEPDEKRYCWIKADTTFNGLKQVMYEPEARVRITPLKPEEKSDYQVIEKVVIEHQDFSSEPIYFNDKLTCIIGGKSTGKSLLLHNLARVIDSKQVKEKVETSQSNTKQIENVQVYWADGTKSESGITDNTHKIVYIPQTYLNRLSDEHEETTEIDKIIQDIVLMDTDCKEAFDKMNFSIKNYKPELDKTIYDLIQIYKLIEEKKKEKINLGTESGIKKQIEKLKEQKDILSKESSLSEEDINKYDVAIQNVTKYEIEISKIQEELHHLSVVTEIVVPATIEFEFSENIKKEIDEAIKQIIENANMLWLGYRFEIQEKLSKRFNELNVKLMENEKIVKELGKKLAQNEAISQIARKIKQEEDKLLTFLELETQINSKERQYKSLLDELTKVYEKFYRMHREYAELVNNNSLIDAEGLEFSVQVPFKKEAFYSFINSNFDKRTMRAKKEIMNIDDFSIVVSEKDKLGTLIDACVTGLLPILKGQSVENILRILLSDWYNTTYNVKMDNDTIDEMSPGKKALVLLKLLISLADSKCPILIDQPEDDLDNRSVFDELIPFIRDKKIVRQIIIVTHNANVVLGGDAEEIIIANQRGNNSPNKEFRFEYRTGSIENNMPVYDDLGNIEKGMLNEKGIQQHICDILEGGEKAFDLRKHKYCI